jgi:hypothetical protein
MQDFEIPVAMPDMDEEEKRLCISATDSCSALNRTQIFNICLTTMRKMCASGISGMPTDDGRLPINSMRLAIISSPTVFMVIMNIANRLWGVLPEPIPGVEKGLMLTTLIAADGYSMRLGILLWHQATQRSFCTLWVMATRLSQVLSREVFEVLMDGRSCEGFCHIMNMTPPSYELFHLPMPTVSEWLKDLDSDLMEDITTGEWLEMTSKIDFETSCNPSTTNSNTFFDSLK